MSKPRNGLPYIWCTWLTPFLSGDRNCWWAPFFQAHHQDIASPEDRSFDLTSWTAQHSAMVRARADELIAQGWTVYLEDQNDFKLKGKTAILSGKMDILAIKDQHVLVIDCKTGKEKDDAVWQVIIYLYAAPKHAAIREREDRASLTISGEVAYKHRRVEVPPLSDPRQAQSLPTLFAAIAKAAGHNVPDYRPSAKECRTCKISKADCAKRIELAEDPKTDVTEF